MLQTQCPKCRGVIESPYLAELSSIECSQCKEEVAVTDIFVATKGFTMHRQDLLNRISRFQRLLREVEIERQQMAKEGTASAKSKQSIEQFYTTLQELLAGARNNFRLNMPYDLYLEMDFEDKRSKGKLINLSSEGASIEFEKLDKRPRNKSEIKLQLQLPKFTEPLSLLAKVVWVKDVTNDAASKYCNVGVKFLNLDEKICSGLWNFIVETASGPESQLLATPSLKI